MTGRATPVAAKMSTCYDCMQHKREIAALKEYAGHGHAQRRIAATLERARAAVAHLTRRRGRGAARPHWMCRERDKLVVGNKKLSTAMAKSAVVRLRRPRPASTALGRG